MLLQSYRNAISLKLKKVEAGAQGPHKIKRGYIPTATYSAHFIFNKELQKFLANTMKWKKNIINDIEEIKKEYSPYKTNSSAKK